MDYEKAYKAVLKAATQWIKDGCTDKEKICLESVIPQLRESEDERIRKALVDFFDSALGKDLLQRKCGLNPDAVLAYLEKQKEQKHPNGCFTCDEYKKGYEEGRRNGFTAGYNKAMKEVEQKEQKPILEVFGFKVGDAVKLKDGDGRKHIIKSFEEVEGLHGPNFYHVEFEDNSARSGIYPDEEYPNGFYTQMEKFEEEQKPTEGDNETEIQKAFREGKSAGRKEVIDHPEEYGLVKQKPAEWDDYTKTNLDRAIRIIKDAKGNLQGYQTDDGIYECDKAIEALEHFLYRGLEIEKPAEWSEEDEEIFNNIIEKAKGGHWIEVNEITWLIARFKSLRPHWKPTEEQMNALYNVIHPCDPVDKEQLESLYERLQRL